MISDSRTDRLTELEKQAVWTKSDTDEVAAAFPALLEVARAAHVLIERNPVDSDAYWATLDDQFEPLRTALEALERIEG